jgi:hypothetical protein
MNFLLRTTAIGNEMEHRSVININETDYNPEEYTFIRKYMESVINAEAQMIVLSRQ